MKKIFCVIICGLLILSLSSCSVIKNIKERAQKAALKGVIELSEDDDLVGLYNASLGNTFVSISKIDSSVSYKINNIVIEGAEDDKSLDNLKAAAKILSSLILENKPGFENKTLVPGETDGTQLKEIGDGKVLDITVDRNYRTENVTDEKGDTVKNEDGSAVTEQIINDNIAKIKLSFFKYETIEEETTDADGNTVEAVTERSASEDGTIEEVFGKLREKDTVLSLLEPLKNYIQVDDYSISYGDCFIKSDVDLDLNLLNDVTYEKNMTVTAAVTGVGVLSKYGSFTLTFGLDEISSYSFDYPDEIVETAE